MIDHQWNPLWRDPEDDLNAEYLAAIRRMIMASVNWIANNPDRLPEWREPDKRSIARAKGVSDTIPLEEISFIGAWEDFYIPRNTAARFWFRAIADACGRGRNAPSSHMFGKAVAAGSLVKRLGWEEFNRFMLDAHDDKPDA